MQVYVSQPFDTIKVKLQTFPKLYKNMFSCLKYTYQTDGVIKGLYAGTVPAAVASIAENSVLFAAYGRCQSLVANAFEIEDSGGLSVLGDASSGFIAAFFTALILCPAELIKCKMQAVNEMKHYVSKDSKVVTINPFMVTKDILETEGIRGLYRGLGTTFVREMPGLFFFFGGYEGARTIFAEPGQSKDEIGPLRTMAAGAIGGVSLWTFTFPADVIKTRIQVDHNKSIENVTFSPGDKLTQGIVDFTAGSLGKLENTQPNQSKDDIGPLKTMFAGAVGGVTLWTSIFPADVIKSRIQVNNLKRSMTSVGLEIFRTEGTLALYNGLLPSVLRTIPATATLFLVYEYTKKTINGLL
uniref:Mitochondrial ornithine transporter 1 n=1 Tax=Glossina brevipalpis TaxID=37001 RepID=A0A1A9WNG3_9MUSC